jgi:hypothetical protein
MGIFDSVKNSAAKAKLNAEIVLLDRQINTQLHSFGVEFFDKLVKAAAPYSNSSTSTLNAAVLPSSAVADAMRSVFDECRHDVQAKQNEHDANRIEAEKVACNKERSAAKSLNQSTMTKAGNWMTDTSKEAQLKVRNKLLEREINQRKGQFGVEVFDIVLTAMGGSGTAAASGGGGGGALAAAVAKTKSGIIGTLAGSHAADKEAIAKCIANASRAVGLLRAQKDSKLREIAAIDQGVFR